MIADGRDAASVTPEEIEKIAADAEIFRQQHKISKTAMAQKLGYSPGVIVEFLAGKYKGNNGQVAIDVDAWIDDEERRRSQPELTQFVWTNVAVEIRATATYCLDERTIGLVYGPDTSGFGKTTALMAIHQSLGPRQSALCTFDKVDSSISGILVKLCGALHMDDSGSNRNRFGRLVKKLANEDRRAGNENGKKFIFLLDQIHNLRGAKDDKPFYVLADLFDATRTAQLWCGTADIAEYLQRQRRRGDEPLAQIRRRIFPAIDLVQALSSPEYGGQGGPMCVSSDQVREMFAKHKLRLTPAAIRFAVQLANQPESGSIGLLVAIVKYASLRASLLERGMIDVDLLKDALSRGLTQGRAEFLLGQIGERESDARMRKAG